jgi:hypothetical protein
MNAAVSSLMNIEYDQFGIDTHMTLNHGASLKQFLLHSAHHDQFDSVTHYARAVLLTFNLFLLTGCEQHYCTKTRRDGIQGVPDVF